MFSSRKTAAPSTGYNLTKSLRFRSSASAYLSRTFGTSGTDNRIRTISIWLKRGAISARQIVFGGYDNSSAFEAYVSFNSNDTIQCALGGGDNTILTTTAVYRDPAAWYHIVFAIDTTQATASNRYKLYVNGVQVTSFTAANYPTINYATQFAYPSANNTIGKQPSSTNYFDGYLAEFNFVDGQALTPSSFGSTNATTGVWQPAKYTCTYGTN